tara:strand:+ start:2326 stop:3225 length:900 start_codon:yes stop_codon:yes gene_type:complete
MLEKNKIKTTKVNLFYLGLPKCASTWLYEVLKESKNVILSEPRDLHFFDLYFYRGIDWYHKFFNLKEENYDINLMDICHDYLFYKSAIARIKKYNPKSILIVHFRDPLDFVHSLYNECCQNSFVYFMEHGYYRPSNFEDFLNHPFTNKILNYKNNIDNVLELFPSDQILISSNEYIKNNLKGYLNNFEKATKINLGEIKDRSLIIRPFGGKSIFIRYLTTLLSFLSMQFRRSGIPILIRIINFKSFLNRFSYPKNKKTKTLNLINNVSDKFDNEILDLFKKLNGMNYRTFIEKYSSKLD